MRMLLTFTFCIAAALATSDLRADDKSRFNPAWSTVLVGQQALGLAKQCSRDSPVDARASWLPSRAQIAEIEPALEILLAKELEHDSRGSAHVGDYYRQYAGLILKGRRIVYVNGFDRKILEMEHAEHQRFFWVKEFDWTTEPMMYCDGGLGFFGVEYDPIRKTFENFSFNGVA